MGGTQVGDTQACSYGLCSDGCQPGCVISGQDTPWGPAGVCSSEVYVSDWDRRGVWLGMQRCVCGEGGLLRQGVRTLS